MERYVKFSTRFICRLYADHYAAITTDPLPHAAVAVGFSRLSGETSVMRRAFYDLARDSLPHNDHAKENYLESLQSRDLLSLVKVQRGLFIASEFLSGVLDFTCPGVEEGSCSRRHQSELGLEMRRRYPANPIIGIRELLDVDWLAHGYCENSASSIRRKLVDRRGEIWDEMAEWLGIVLIKTETTVLHSI